jgi:hypothetical protein
MTLRIPELQDSYDSYKQEIQAWKRIKEMPKKKQGIVVALSLPRDGAGNIRRRVFDEIKLEELETENGKHLASNSIEDSFVKFEELEDCRKGETESIIEYISKFDQKYIRLVRNGMELPSPILAFKLLKSANLRDEERMLVLSGMDYNTKDTLFEQAKLSLKKFMGNICGRNEMPGSFRLEPCLFNADDDNDLEEVCVCQPRRWSNKSRGSNKYRNSGRGQYGRQQYRGENDKGESEARPVNPTGRDGKPLRCRVCGSFRPLLGKCPDSWENQDNVNFSSDDCDEEAVLCTSDHTHTATLDSRNCAVLDTACSSTVCGQPWLDCYLDDLDAVNKRRVHYAEGRKVCRRKRAEVKWSLPSACMYSW